MPGLSRTPSTSSYAYEARIPEKSTGAKARSAHSTATSAAATLPARASALLGFRCGGGGVGIAGGHTVRRSAEQGSLLDGDGHGHVHLGGAGADEVQDV